MTTQTHTPGPWDYDCYGEHFSFFGNDGREDYSFRVEYNKEMPEEEQFENNHLIAAAPDMRDALQAVVDAFGGQDSLLIDQCKAALAKSIGKQ